MIRLMRRFALSLAALLAVTLATTPPVRAQPVDVDINKGVNQIASIAVPPF